MCCNNEGLYYNTISMSPSVIVSIYYKLLKQIALTYDTINREKINGGNFYILNQRRCLHGFLREQIE